MSSTIRFSADGSRKDGRGNNFFIIEKEIFQLKDLQSFDFTDFQTLIPIFFMSSEALKLEHIPGVRR